MSIKSPRQLQQLLHLPPRQGYIHEIKGLYRYKEVIKTKHGHPQTDGSNFRIRALYVSDPPLKMIQQNISLSIQHLTEATFSFGAVRGRSSVLNALQHFGNKYFLSIDLKNFFPNIGYRQVYRTLIGLGCSADVAKYITELSTYKGSLQQGPPSSPVIANLVFLDTGKRLAELAIKHNLIFTSYLDDLTFSGQQDFRHLVEDIKNIIREDGFRLAHKKIAYKTGVGEVTGIFITAQNISVPYKILNKAKSNAQVAGYAGWVSRIRQFIATQMQVHQMAGSSIRGLIIEAVTKKKL